MVCKNLYMSRSNQWWGLSWYLILRSISGTSNILLFLSTLFSIADGKYIGISNELLKSVRLFKNVLNTSSISAWIFWGLIVFLNKLAFIFGTGLKTIWNYGVSDVGTYFLWYI